MVENLGSTLVNLLAVAGGAAVGWFGTAWLVQVIVRLWVHRKVPRPILTLVRALGSVTLGLAIWLLVFGTGGKGWGLGGSGWGLGSGGTGGGASTAPVSTDRQRPQTTGVIPEAGPSEVLRVVMLGGARVEGNRYYVIEGEKEKLSLDELEAIIRQRKPALKRLEIKVYLNSVAETHSAVLRLQEKARDQDLKVDTTKLERDAP